jgi:hypothetical protein
LLHHYSAHLRIIARRVLCQQITMSDLPPLP